MSKQGSLFVLIGPSGSGKGTVLKEVLIDDNNTFLSISATTRNPRPGEKDGKDYLFITKEEFKKLIKTESMLEYACYCDNYYGTPKATVLNRLNNGQNVILEIEMQGAKQIKSMYEDAILIFIIPPSLEVLRQRLTGRATEDIETINKRMNTAINEIEFAKECDFVVINDTLSKAIDDVKAIIKACSHRSCVMQEFINELTK